MTPKEKAIKYFNKFKAYGSNVGLVEQSIDIALKEQAKRIFNNHQCCIESRQEQAKQILDECREYVPEDIMFWIDKKYLKSIRLKIYNLER